VSTNEVADDWEQRWRAFHRPLLIGERLAVRPPWEPPIGTRVELVIDPGRAFGTGAHATTRLCLEALLELAPGEGALVDLGCGSGVLAVAAARLGWRPVRALDHDPAAVEATAHNARANGVGVDAKRFDLRTDPVEASVAPTVAANLLAPVLATWSQRLGEIQDRPDLVIAGGVLEAEADGVAAAFAPLGLHERERRVAGDWVALVLSR
jgi:ribosomal protein L11 methyltransferase